MSGHRATRISESRIQEIFQMLDAPYDVYADHQWCHAANDLGSEVHRLRSILEDLRDEVWRDGRGCREVAREALRVE